MGIKKQNERIELLQYRTIEKGFYEVVGLTDTDKIAIEGNVCAGILLSLMEKTKQDKGKIVRYYSPLDIELNAPLKKIRDQNIQLVKQNKILKKKIRKANQILKSSL